MSRLKENHQDAIARQTDKAVRTDDQSPQNVDKESAREGVQTPSVLGRWVNSGKN